METDCRRLVEVLEKKIKKLEKELAELKKPKPKRYWAGEMDE